MKLEDIIHHNIAIKLQTLKTDQELVTQIQTQLNLFGFYPGKTWLDGDYGKRTDEALTQFCRQYSLSSKTKDRFDSDFAQQLLFPSSKPSPKPDYQTPYQKFLKDAAAGIPDEPALLYKGIATSPYKKQINDYPRRLLQKPDGKNIVSLAQNIANFQSYPLIGQLPEIDEEGLQFLHPDITEACICVAVFVERQLKVRWLGRNALANDEFWSSTKIIPLIQLVTRLNSRYPRLNIDRTQIRGRDQLGNWDNFTIAQLAQDLISYEDKIASSNSLGAMFKRFSTQIENETWLKNITGNKNIIFRGRYGETPFIDQPEVVNQDTGEILLSPDPKAPQWSDNTISAYDLNRMISLLGWHYYIPYPSRLPGAQWHSLESIIRAMGRDPARLADLAIEELGLKNQIESAVILSKLGNGVTSIRKRTEAVYLALVQFTDHSSQKWGQPGKFISVSMALRGAKQLNPRDLKREAWELDARMATEVTEILRRATMGELA